MHHLRDLIHRNTQVLANASKHTVAPRYGARWITTGAQSSYNWFFIEHAVKSMTPYRSARAPQRGLSHCDWFREVSIDRLCAVQSRQQGSAAALG
jgi:hypothetical protein